MGDHSTAAPAYISAILLRQKWQILIVFALVAGGIAAATFLMPKEYETRLKILVKNERADVIVSADPNGGSGYRNEISEAQINSEIELLTSNDLLQQIVTKVGLERLGPFSGSKNEPVPIRIERARSQLQKRLKVSPVRKASIIQVEYTNKDPHMAVAVLRVLADSYLEAHLRLHGTPGTYEFFTGQAKRYETALADSEVKLAEFRQQENIVIIDVQKQMMLQKISESESTLKQAEATIGEYASRIADIRTRLGNAEPRVITQSRVVPNQYSVERLNTMLAELQNRRTQLMTKFLPTDRSVQEVDQEIADTQNALKEASKMSGVEQSTDINPVHQALQLDMAKAQNELAGVEALRRVVSGQLASYRDQLMEFNDATMKYDDLIRDRKEAEDNYLLYTKKTEEARIAESLDQQKIANVVIAEQPIEPQLPSKPNVPLSLVLGMVLAGFLSVGIAFGREYFTDTVAHPAELENLTGLPVLAAPYRRLGSPPISVPADTAT